MEETRGRGGGRRNTGETQETTEEIEFATNACLFGFDRANWAAHDVELKNKKQKERKKNTLVHVL